jgi:hypothetical protein
MVPLWWNFYGGLNRNYSYELFQLITEKNRSNLQQKLYAKTYYIICLLCRPTHMESNKIRFFILWFLCDLLWFFKDLAEINKKEKDKIAFKTVYNRVREVKHTVSKVKEDGLSNFKVQEKNKFCWERKSERFPILYMRFLCPCRRSGRRGHWLTAWRAIRRPSLGSIQSHVPLVDFSL